MIDDPSQTTADLTQWAAQMERKAARFQVLQARMLQLGVTTTSSDKSVTVTIDANGVPTDIRFTDGIRRKNPAALSADLMQCLRSARESLVSDITATVRDVVGDDPTGANIIKQYEDRFAAPAEPAAVPSTVPPPPPTPIWSQPPPPAVPPQPVAPQPPRQPTTPEPLPTPSSLVPDVEDEEGEYYRRASWLV